jgi:hypothetical protein
MPIFDRAETSELFALLFSKMVTNGVLAKPSNCFQVTASGSGLGITIAPGFGMINGRFAYDSAEASLALETAPSSYSRIDRVVLRCNYLDRLCEIIVKTGDPASSPVAPALLQPAAGDYYELGLATVKISANQTVLTQSAITDTRADSSVCGFITQFIDSIDTSVFFAQLNQFYTDFVQEAGRDHDTFTSTIDQYIADLESKGFNDLSAITESFTAFQSEHQVEFTEWFANLKDQLDEDAAGHLQNEITEHEDRLSMLEKMLIQNQITAPLRADDDNATLLLADDLGNVLAADWQYTV